MENPYHYALSMLHLRSTEEEVTHALRWAGWQFLACAQDLHFEQYVFKNVITPEQLQAVVKMLNADRYAMEGDNKEFVCQKTCVLSKNLKYDMAKHPNLTGAYYLSFIRRIHCSCHQVGSFALSSNYTSKMHELYQDKRGNSIWHKSCKV